MNLLREYKIQKLLSLSKTGELFKNPILQQQLTNDYEQLVLKHKLSEMKDIGKTMYCENKYIYCLYGPQKCHWFYEDSDQTMERKKQCLDYKKMQQKFANFLYFQNLSEFKKMEQKNRFNHIYLICNSDNIQSVWNQSRKLQMSIEGEIVVLCLLQNQQQYTSFKFIRDLSKDIKAITSLSKFKQIICETNMELNHAPNFTFISDCSFRHNKRLLNLYWMLLPQNKQQSFKDFCNFARNSEIVENKARELYSFQKMQKDFKQIVNKRSGQVLIKWYTSQTFLYHLINTNLRLFEKSLDFAYLRFIYAEMFRSIQELYFLQNKGKRNIYCYRGFNLTKKEAKKLKQKKGDYIQLEGFISTSEDITIAKNFGKDLLAIEVPFDSSQPSQFFQSFARVSHISQHKAQKQIIFNPLNIFKIINVQFSNKLTINESQSYKVSLLYVQIDKIMKNYDPEDQKSKNLFRFYSYQKQSFERIKNQGTLMLQCLEYKEALSWFLKYLAQIIKSIVSNQKENNLKAVFSTQMINDLTSVLMLIYAQKIQLKRTKQEWKTIAIGIAQRQYNQDINILKQIGICLQKRKLLQEATVFYQCKIQILEKKYNNKDCLLNQEKTQKQLSQCLLLVNTNPYISKFPEKALKNIIKSTQIRQRLYGSESFELAEALFMKANFFKINKQIDQSLKSMRLFIQIWKKAQGLAITYRQSNCYASALLMIGQLLIEKKIFAQGLEKFYQCKNRYENSIDRDLNIYLSALNEIGCFYLFKQNYDLSLDYFLKCELQWIRWDHYQIVNLAKLMENIGECYFQTFKLEQAKYYFTKRNKIFQNITSKQSLQNLQTFNFEAKIYEKYGLYYQSLDCFLKRNCIQIEYQLIFPQTDAKILFFFLHLVDSKTAIVFVRNTIKKRKLAKICNKKLEMYKNILAKNISQVSQTAKLLVCNFYLEAIFNQLINRGELIKQNRENLLRQKQKIMEEIIRLENLLRNISNNDKNFYLTQQHDKIIQKTFKNFQEPAKDQKKPDLNFSLRNPRAKITNSQFYPNQKYYKRVCKQQKGNNFVKGMQRIVDDLRGVHCQQLTEDTLLQLMTVISKRTFLQWEIVIITQEIKNKQVFVSSQIALYTAFIFSLKFNNQNKQKIWELFFKLQKHIKEVSINKRPKVKCSMQNYYYYLSVKQITMTHRKYCEEELQIIIQNSHKIIVNYLEFGTLPFQAQIINLLDKKVFNKIFCQIQLEQFHFLRRLYEKLQKLRGQLRI